MGATKMRPGKKGQSVARALLLVAMAAAAVAAGAVLSSGDTFQLADIFWTAPVGH